MGLPYPTLIFLAVYIPLYQKGLYTRFFINFKSVDIVFSLPSFSVGGQIAQKTLLPEVFDDKTKIIVFSIDSLT